MAIEQLTHNFPSAVIHAVGTIVFLLLTPALVRSQRSPERRAGAAFFAFSIVFLLSMSTLFHWVTHVHGDETPPSEAFRRLDLLAIWVVIAGTMTPIQLTCFRGPWRWIPLAILVPACALGVLVKVFFFGVFSLSANFSMYVAVGLVALVAVVRATREHGVPFMRLLLIGYGVFAVGAVFFAVRPPDLIPGLIGQHEVWHTCVLAGMGASWVWVQRTAAFEPGPRAAESALPEEDLVASA